MQVLLYNQQTHEGSTYKLYFIFLCQYVFLSVTTMAYKFKKKFFKYSTYIYFLQLSKVKIKI